jgi:uncharacterized protein
MSASLPDQLAGLLQPRAYPHAVDAVTLVETHISWILLAGEFAYKIKRPVCFPFIDLRLLERRSYFCREELRLNRRFAPQLYLDVCAVTITAGEARIGGTGELVEHAVKMRRFRRADELDNLLARAQIEPEELASFGRELAAIHSRLPVAELPAPWGDPRTVHTVILKNLEECAQASAIFGCASEVRAMGPGFERRLEAALPWMSNRREGGRVRECHGDLHAANVVRLESRLVAFDCMEFEPAFRWIDVAEEIGFLLADLDARGYPRHAWAFLDGYLAQSGDYQACRLLPLYEAHRALVRAKVTALSQAGSGAASLDDIGRPRYRAYLDCATRALAGKRPTLVLMSGLSGSGKTWLAHRLAPALGAVHLRSDVERKRLAGLAEHSRSGAAVGKGLYSRELSRQVYQHLARVAEDVLAGGYAAIVDATFSRREERGVFRELARRLGVAACLIHCRAPHEVLMSRIVERYAQAADASEADVAVLDWQKEHWEPIGTDEQWAVIAVETAHAELSELLGRIGALKG